MKIAIPSVLPGGLEAQVGAHFGHCDCYTLVDVEDGAVVKSEVAKRAAPSSTAAGWKPPSHTLRSASIILTTKPKATNSGGSGMP